MRLIATLLLLAAVAATPSFARALPTTMDEYERRWSQGESEVCTCTLGQGTGCYVLAWFRSLSKGSGKERGRVPASIHANHNIREATPAWPIVRSYADLDDFSYATDERTMALRRLGRREKRGEVTASPSLVKKMRAFVERFYRSRGEKSVLGRREGEAAEVEEAPVLKPRGPYRYRFNA